MTEREISQLPAATVLDGTEFFPIVQAGVTKKAPIGLATPLPAGGNLTFYVSPSGSDSNSGTLAQPFLTIQHAVDIAAAFDWQNLYGPTIQLATGAYVAPLGTIVLPTLINMDPGQASPLVVGDFGNPGGYILSNGFGGPIFSAKGGTNNWSIAGLQCNTNAAIVSLSIGAIFDMDVVNLLSGTGQAVAAICTEGSHCQIEIMNFLSNFGGLFVLDASSGISGNQLDFGGFTVSTMLQLANFSKCEFVTNPLLLLNTGGCAGARAILSEYSIVVTPNGSLADIPGGSDGSFDVTCGLASQSSGRIGFFESKGSGLPTASQIPPSAWAVYKDTSGGNMYVAANDGGSIKKVMLRPPSSVKDFGAIGDGVANDTAAIQAALDSGRGSPIVVSLPAGTYKVYPPNAFGTSALAIHYDNITLIGDGPGVSIIKVYVSGGRDPNTNFDAIDTGLGQSVWRGSGIYVRGNPQDSGVRAVNFASTGKKYFECVNNGSGVGLSGTSYVVLDPPTGSSRQLLGSFQSVAVFAGNPGNIFINSLSPAGNIGNTSNTDTIAIAVDLTARLFWAKNLTTAGNWNNSGTANPATGVGGLSIASLPSLVAPTLDLEDSCGATMKFGATAFTGTVPSGFTAWSNTLNPNDYDYVRVALSNGNLTAQRTTDGSSGRHNIVIENLRLTLQCLRSTANWPFGGSDPPFQPSLFGANADGWDLTHKAILFEVNQAHANVRIRNCEIDGCKGEMIDYGGSTFTNLGIEDNFLHDCNADVISCMAGPMVIRGNTIRDATNIVENSPFNQDLTIESNYCVNANNGFVVTNQSVSGGDAVISGKTIIRDNTVILAHKIGCFIQAVAKQVWVHHNTFVDCGTSNSCINVSLNFNGNFLSAVWNIFIEDNQFYADTIACGACIRLSEDDPSIAGKYIRRNRSIQTSFANINGLNFTFGILYSLLGANKTFVEDNDFSSLQAPAFVLGSGSISPIFRRNVAARALPFPERTMLFTQFDKTSNTTLSSAGFAIPVGLAEVYLISGKLLVTANASGGAKIALGFSVGATPTTVFIVAKLYAGTSIVASGSVSAINTLIAGATAAVDLIELNGYVFTSGSGGVGGLLDVQFAQNASFGTASSLLKGSFLEVTEAQLQTSF